MEWAPAFVMIGALFLAGLGADALGHRTRVPRVTLLLLLGIAVGHSGFDLIPDKLQVGYAPLSVLALTMVAFLLGSSLSGKTLRKQGRAILWVSLAIVVITLAVVTTGLWALGLPSGLALILGAIATATAPAAMQETLRDAHAKGPFAKTLRGVVAIDDAWGMIVFSLAVVVAGMLEGSGYSAQVMSHAAYDILGALALGAAVGLPAADLTGHLKKGEPMQIEALGLVFLTAGLALWLEVSFLLAGMTAGAVIVNMAPHHNRAFHQIERIERPFLMIFFLLAGATLEIDQLWQLGWIGVAYVVLRIASRLAGGWVGGGLAGMDPIQRRWIGPALLPQAGVAVGMALVAAQAFPHHAALITTLTIGTTVIFELIGPMTTTLAVRRVQQG